MRYRPGSAGRGTATQLIHGQLWAVRLEDVLGKIMQHDTTTPIEIWESLSFVSLIKHILKYENPTQQQVFALIHLARMVGALSLRVPHLPGATSICGAGSEILRNVFSENVGFITLTQLCPDVFKETYCGLDGPNHERWFPIEWESSTNWPILIDVVVKAAKQDDRDCSAKIQEAVSWAFRSEMVTHFRQVSVEALKAEAVTRFSAKYQDLCPYLILDDRSFFSDWDIFHICDYNGEIVCPIADSWVSDEAILNQFYIGLTLDISSFSVASVKLFIESRMWIRVVNSVHCKAGLLLILNRLLNELDPASIVELRKSLDPELGSEIETMCEHVTTDQQRYVQAFCKEARIQNLVDDPVVWTALWKHYGFQNEYLCSYCRRFELSDQMLRLRYGSLDVSSFLLEELALEALIGKRSVVCEGEENFFPVEAYIAVLVSYTIQVNWQRIRPGSDWETLARAAAPFCEGYRGFGAKTIFTARLCPDQLTYKLLDSMRHRFKSSPISSFCDWLNPPGPRESVLNQYCVDKCYLLAEPYDLIPNRDALEWIQHWGECGSPIDLIEVFISGTFDYGWYDTRNNIFSDIVKMAPEEFNAFVETTFKDWKNVPLLIRGGLSFVDLVGVSLARGFTQFIGSLSPLSLDNIQSFCLKERSWLTTRTRRDFYLMCEQSPLSLREFALSLSGKNIESFCLNYYPKTSQRREVKHRFCDMKCHRLVTDQSLDDFDRWIPLWKQCGSEPDSLCQTSLIVTDFDDFVETSLRHWVSLPDSSCSADFITRLAGGISAELDWWNKAVVITESQRSVVREFCRIEKNRLESIDKLSSVFLFAECDNLPISFQALSVLYEGYGIPPASICSRFETDSRRESIAEFCADPNCHQLSSLSDLLSWAELWIKCHTPADPVCGFLNLISETYNSVDAAVQFALETVSLTDIETLKVKFALSPMIRSIDKLPQCEVSISSYVGATLGFGLERLTKIKLVNLFHLDDDSFGDVSIWCNHHRELVANQVESFPVLSYVCPDLEVPFGTLKSIMTPVIPASVNENRAFETLLVSRVTAFSDWLEVSTIYRFFPKKVSWRNEPGADIGGISRDWITKVADIVSSPPTCDQAGGLFELDPTSKQYLVFSLTKTAGDGSLSAELKDEYYHFGRFLAIALMKGEQVGIPLPVFFFSKLLYRMIRPADLRTIDTERANMFSKLIRDVENVAFGFNADSPLEIKFPELPDVEFQLTKDNVKDEIAKVLDAIYMPGSANQAMDLIRNGLSGIVPVESVRHKLTPAQFKYYVVGDETLDVGELEKLAARDGDRFAVPQISEEVFGLLFDWLIANPQFHRQFMIFTTGSSSLRPRQLIITGPDSAFQGRVPKAHTCFNWLALPEYVDYDELNRMLSEAIFHIRMGMN